MLNFLVTFVVLMAVPRAVIHPSDDSCLSTYPHHSYHNTAACTMYNSFHSLDLTLDGDLMGSIQVWHFYNMAAGCMTHNAGPKTHNAAGHVTQHTFVSSI